MPITCQYQQSAPGSIDLELKTDPSFANFLLTMKSELHSNTSFSQRLSFVVTRERLRDRQPLAVDCHERYIWSTYRTESKLLILNDNPTGKDLYRPFTQLRASLPPCRPVTPESRSAGQSH